LVKVGLEYLGKDRQTRYKMYHGPAVEQIKGLTEDRQERLAEMLAHYKQN
jgi:hypothetical protein